MSPTVGTTAQCAAALGCRSDGKPYTPDDIRWLVSQHPEIRRYGTPGRRQYDVCELRDAILARHDVAA